jgi:lysine decarboxylase/arginine decarboxylase
MLDPIKVTILTPGIGDDGTLDDWGIPAAIVSRFLWRRGIVVEKTGTYSFLVLFSIAVTKGKSGSLVAELFTLKELYDTDARLKDVFPDLAETYERRFGIDSLRGLCAAMHGFYKQSQVIGIIQDVYGVLPAQDMTPAQAYRRVVKGAVESLALDQLDGRTNAVGIVPYPPGIPVIMPGERFDRTRTPRIFEYLEMLQDFDAKFPGFEHEIHGVETKPDPETGQARYVLDCLA